MRPAVLHRDGIDRARLGRTRLPPPKNLTVVHRISDSGKIVRLKRATPLQKSVVDLVDRLFDSLVREINAGNCGLNRRHKIRQSLASTFSGMGVGDSSGLGVIVEPKHDVIKVVFWASPNVVVIVLITLTWHGRNGVRLAMVQCATTFFVHSTEEHRCLLWFEDQLTRLDDIFATAPNPVREGSADD